jgi:hypothetical protein
MNTDEHVPEEFLKQFNSLTDAQKAQLVKQLTCELYSCSVTEQRTRKQPIKQQFG